MKIFAGVLASCALLAFVPAVQAQPKGTPNYYGYVGHQKTGGNHPGGHSSVTGHKKYGGGYSGGGNSDGETHVHTSACGHTCYSCEKPKPQPVARCFPPGHCKSINQGYYGPPGQKGRKGG